MSYRATTLTIASGAAASEELNLTEDGGAAKFITFIMPTTLPETIVVQLADKVGGTYRALNDGFGNDVTLQAAKSQIQSGIVAGALKLVSTSGNVAADRTIIIRGNVQR